MSIKPALSAEEWKAHFAGELRKPLTDPIKLGALLLHGYFTREDIRWLRGICNAQGKLDRPIGREVADSLADRLEALLPPEPGE